MYKLLKISCLLLLMSLCVHAREIIFDLRSQDFVNSLGEKQFSSKYNLDDKIIIQTNMLKNDQAVYHTNSNVTGKFNLYPLRTIFDWTLNVDVQYEGLKDKNRFIKLTDENGVTILLELNTIGFIFNAIDYNAKLDKKHLLIQLVKKNETVEFYLNKQLIDTQLTNFSKIKSVETTFYKFSLYDKDKLNNILLVSND